MTDVQHARAERDRAGATLAAEEEKLAACRQEIDEITLAIKGLDPDDQHGLGRLAAKRATTLARSEALGARCENLSQELHDAEAALIAAQEAEHRRQVEAVLAKMAGLDEQLTSTIGGFVNAIADLVVAARTVTAEARPLNAQVSEYRVHRLASIRIDTYGDRRTHVDAIASFLGETVVAEINKGIPREIQE